MRLRPTLAALVLALTACSAPSLGSGAEPDARGCGPLTHAKVLGPRPDYARGERLDRFDGDFLACHGIWLDVPDFVPQGLAISGRTAWVSGYPGVAGVGERFCRLARVDLESGRVFALLDALADSTGRRCRHGGGLAVNDVGLWVMETHRLWLLDPKNLRVQRVWELIEPLVGSTGTIRPRAVGDELALGEFRVRRPGVVWWFSIQALLAPNKTTITRDDVLRRQPVEQNVQGLAWDRGLLVARSVTRCGVLRVGGADRAFVPGAEGIARSGGLLWVASEAGTRKYFTAGGRPLVPTLVALDARNLTALPQNQRCLR